MSSVYLHLLFRRNTEPSSHTPVLRQFLHGCRGRVFMTLFMDQTMLIVTFKDEDRGIANMRHSALIETREWGLWQHWSFTGDCVMEPYGRDTLFVTLSMESVRRDPRLRGPE